MIIREENPGDIETIHQLTYDTFAPMTFSDNSEADCINRLREDGDLFISLVAIVDDAIVGHIAFSKASIDATEGAWVGLGPISVHPDHQRRGIGRAMIADGLAKLKHHGADGCVLIGNPDVYSSSGFISDGRLTYKEIPVQFVQHVRFTATSARGEITFAPALEATG